MKVLLCHTYYTQRGGEDRSFEEERELLVANGHCVVEYVRRNDELASQGGLAAAANTLWNRQAAREVTELIRREAPDVMHCTNSFPLISPAVCHAARREGVAVVQALRNYRLLCAGAYLMRDGRPCEECIGRAVPWPAVVHGCYRDSTAASAAVAAMQMLHRALGTWRRTVDAFFTLTEFARGKFVAGGFPAERVHVKHNCVQPDPGVGDGAGGYAVFAGRLSPEKGVGTLLEAWRLDATLPPLKVVGDGPLLPEVEAAAARDPRITATGLLGAGDVHRLMRSAAVVVVPSLWYETFGRTIAEAYAVGAPVVASRLGAMAELVEDGVTGLQFKAGDAGELAAKVRQVVEAAADERLARRRRARGAFETRYTPQRNYERLIEIYDLALRHAAQRSTRTGRALRAEVGVAADAKTLPIGLTSGGGRIA